MKNYQEIEAALREEFPREQVSWRAQTLTKDKKKAMALAYIDSRDVQDRLDAVVGAAGWEDDIETQGDKTICRLSIWMGDRKITKTDGAGDTTVEAEKGAISDAFKRAAVKWGIGRYLYDLPAVWVPCETYNDKFSSWSEDPWDYVDKIKKRPSPPAEGAKTIPTKTVPVKEGAPTISVAAIQVCMSMGELISLWTGSAKTLNGLKTSNAALYQQLEAAKDKRKLELTDMEKNNGQ
jgi:hypothetical protein